MPKTLQELLGAEHVGMGSCFRLRTSPVQFIHGRRIGREGFHALLVRRNVVLDAVLIFTSDLPRQDIPDHHAAAVTNLGEDLVGHRSRYNICIVHRRNDLNVG